MFTVGNPALRCLTFTPKFERIFNLLLLGCPATFSAPARRDRYLLLRRCYTDYRLRTTAEPCLLRPLGKLRGLFTL
jgi:hypothetical protein